MTRRSSTLRQQDVTRAVKAGENVAHIEIDTPLRLAVAASLAFPDGSMTASGLRREAARGRLVIERIAGNDYTTLADIKRMREKCRNQPRVPDCGSAASGATSEAALPILPCGTSVTTTDCSRAQDAASMIVEALNAASPTTSADATSRRRVREGLCSQIVDVILPPERPSRERWLTRSEAARLIRAAWRYREVQKGRLTDRRSRQHIARFILVALYTGTRASAVCGAALQPMEGVAGLI